jgi:hypothetical protein
VMNAITEPLTRHGFSLAWVPSTGERGSVKVTCRLTHSEGHSEECSLESERDTSGSKSSAQAVASTITLLQRYTALSLLGIATADMVEETGERAPSSGDVDPTRNLGAAKRLVDRGFVVAEIERMIGRPVKDWTSSDIDRIRAHVTAPKHDPSSGEVAPEDER